ncbi:MAG: hypothetical protein Q7S22_08640 [Candidatus Micrarchaeota archaeon]|nr:hypothetical protein [Candidatus Micrarchaeota archaeon]
MVLYDSDGFSSYDLSPSPRQSSTERTEPRLSFIPLGKHSFSDFRDYIKAHRPLGYSITEASSWRIILANGIGETATFTDQGTSVSAIYSSGYVGGQVGRVAEQFSNDSPNISPRQPSTGRVAYDEITLDLGKSGSFEDFKKYVTEKIPTGYSFAQSNREFTLNYGHNDKSTFTLQGNTVHVAYWSMYAKQDIHPIIGEYQQYLESSKLYNITFPLERVPEEADVKYLREMGFPCFVNASKPVTNKGAQLFVFSDGTDSVTIALFKQEQKIVIQATRSVLTTTGFYTKVWQDTQQDGNGKYVLEPTWMVKSAETGLGEAKYLEAAKATEAVFGINQPHVKLNFKKQTGKYPTEQDFRAFVAQHFTSKGFTTDNYERTIVRGENSSKNDLGEEHIAATYSKGTTIVTVSAIILSEAQLRSSRSELEILKTAGRFTISSTDVTLLREIRDAFKNPKTSANAPNTLASAGDEVEVNIDLQRPVFQPFTYAGSSQTLGQLSSRGDIAKLLTSLLGDHVRLTNIGVGTSSSFDAMYTVYVDEKPLKVVVHKKVQEGAFITTSHFSITGDKSTVDKVTKHSEFMAVVTQICNRPEEELTLPERTEPVRRSSEFRSGRSDYVSRRSLSDHDGEFQRPPRALDPVDSYREWAGKTYKSRDLPKVPITRKPSGGNRGGSGGGWGGSFGGSRIF